ncbi:Nitrilotriacetate monooxygenase component A/pristinamycin IIA synthase subunit A [Amniculicola lignicola CBS 123094]|uniref:Nitrilotriacetate monooxygenase component A/pristinamycin IIA synthase subunit A n=1 Tax=Amniculicola lignicola CBS 123094 TaxID=1392246 RepID=A0A6A5WM48_9PLEO|nr:Nitrilotriacetate monooxygenase component A/pristinamycin IIA synthase subunit A [Amniculicola lignicola CBS 123094]
MAIGQWKDPKSLSRHKDRLDYYVWLAKTAEKGKITSIFFADIYGILDTYGTNADATFKGGLWVAMLDPVTLIGAMAQATTSIGFAVTQSTSYLSPYAVARTLSSLDHISNGRVGINIVTSFGKAPAQCFGIEDAVPHDERYAAAEEYMEILYKLWEQSWEDGAQVWQAEPEMAYDPSKIHKIDFQGKYHKFKGYHQTHPSPQRSPAIFQAGQSKSGIAFAGKHAEGIYCGTPTISKLNAYADTVRQSARDAGRDPSTVKLFCSLCPIVGKTEEEANAKYEKYKKNASVQGGLASFCALTGVDLGKYALDDPFNFDDEELSKAGIQGIFNNFKTIQGDKAWTPRMVGERVGMGGFGPMPVGTPEQVADVMEKWFIEGDIDGFNISYQCNPESIEDLVELVIPELQKRGIYWNDYPSPGGTLRENMQNRPGQALTPPDHPSAKLRWDKVKTADVTNAVNGTKGTAATDVSKKLVDAVAEIPATVTVTS